MVCFVSKVWVPFSICFNSITLYITIMFGLLYYWTLVIFSEWSFGLSISVKEHYYLQWEKTFYQKLESVLSKYTLSVYIVTGRLVSSMLIQFLGCGYCVITLTLELVLHQYPWGFFTTEHNWFLERLITSDYLIIALFWKLFLTRNVSHLVLTLWQTQPSILLKTNHNRFIITGTVQINSIYSYQLLFSCA